MGTKENKPELEKQATGLSDEVLLALRGLTAKVRPDVWGFWSEALPNGPEVAEVRVSSILFDPEGNPVAIGIKHSEMTRVIEEHGDPTSPSAGCVGVRPSQELLVNVDGTDTWPPFKFDPNYKPPLSLTDPYDIPYI